MGCCSSTNTPDLIGPTREEYHVSVARLECTKYNNDDKSGDIEIEVVCITKPEISYIVKVAVDQLHSLTLRDLETQVISDMSDHMIENFRFLHTTHIEKPFYNEKLVRMIDLLPIYVELSVDETIDFIQFEIPWMKHVINLPFDSNTTIKYYKKKIAMQLASLDSSNFEFLHAGELLRFDDMSLAECSILPGSKLIVLDPLTAQNHAHTVFFEKKGEGSNFDESTRNFPANILDAPTFEALQLLQNTSMNNITRIISKGDDDDEYTVQDDQIEIQTIDRVDDKGKRNSNHDTINLIEEEVSPIDKAILIQDFVQDFQSTLAAGLDITAECTDISCDLFQEKTVFHLGFGEFFLNAEEQKKLVKCKKCEGETIPQQFVFRRCSYMISGVYKKKEQAHLHRKDKTNKKETNKKEKLLKKNDGQWIHEVSEKFYNFKAGEIEWKQVRARVSELKNNSLQKCCLCTQKIDIINKEQAKKLIQCEHVYHALCYEKIQKHNLPCVMCVF